MTSAVLALIMTYLQRPFQFELLFRAALPIIGNWLLHFIRLTIQLLLMVFLVMAVTEWSRGRRCQHCNSRHLQCRHVALFGYRYYLCSDCGGRQKRLPGGSWSDAPGSADDEKFLGRLPSDPWNGSEDPGVFLDSEQVGPAKTGIEQALRRRRERLATPSHATVGEDQTTDPTQAIDHPSRSPSSVPGPSEDRSV